MFKGGQEFSPVAVGCFETNPIRLRKQQMRSGFSLGKAINLLEDVQRGQNGNHCGLCRCFLLEGMALSI
jgi:hypothetical protein